MVIWPRGYGARFKCKVSFRPLDVSGSERSEGSNPSVTSMSFLILLYPVMLPPINESMLSSSVSVRSRAESLRTRPVTHARRPVEKLPAPLISFLTLLLTL